MSTGQITDPSQITGVRPMDLDKTEVESIHSKFAHDALVKAVRECKADFRAELQKKLMHVSPIVRGARLTGFDEGFECCFGLFTPPPPSPAQSQSELPLQAEESPQKS